MGGGVGMGWCGRGVEEGGTGGGKGRGRVLGLRKQVQVIGGGREGHGRWRRGDGEGGPGVVGGLRFGEGGSDEEMRGCGGETRPTPFSPLKVYF